MDAVLPGNWYPGTVQKYPLSLSFVWEYSLSLSVDED